MQNFKKYYIIVKSNNKLLYKNYILKIDNLLKFLKFDKYNVKYLPTNIKKYTVLKSPHVHKKFMETFEERIYSCIIILYTKDSKKYLYLKKFLENNIPLSLNLIFKEINILK